MTIASLVVHLSAETADFHDRMEDAARHMEMMGRRIARAGHEITLAVAPFAAIVAGGLLAAVKQSALVHGELAQAWDRLTLSARELFREIGGALTPAFLQVAEAKGGLIEKARQLVAWFEQLSPSTQHLIVQTGLFLAALGPTIFAVGAAVRAFGALWSILTMLSALLSSALLKALAFLISPIGLIIVGVGLLVAAVALLIRHWEQVKQVGLEAWNALKLGVINAIDGMLAGLEHLAIAAHLPGLVDTFTHARDALGVMRLHTLQEGEALDELGRHITKLPLLPDWLRHPITALGLKFPSFTLPQVPPMPTTAMLQAADVLAKLDTQMKENLVSAAALGSRFDLTAANAQAYKSAVDELIKLGIPLGTSLDSTGRSVQQLGKEFQALQLAVGVSQSIRQGIGGAFEGLAAQLGTVFAGMTHGFKGFGATMEGLLGGMLTTLGKVLIAYGVAGLAIKKFIVSPGGAIAAGVALLALGSALSSAAQNTLNTGAGAGGGGGGATAASAPAAAAAAPPVQIVITGTWSPNDPRFVDLLAQGLSQALDRNVLVLPAPT